MTITKSINNISPQIHSFISCFRLAFTTNKYKLNWDKLVEYPPHYMNNISATILRNFTHA